MTENNTLKQVSDTLTDKPVLITVDLKPQNRMHALGQRLRLLPRKKTFAVSQVTTGNLVRISKLLVDIGGDWKELIEDPYRAISAYGPHLVRIVAVCLHNRKQEPPDSLYDLVEHNMTAAEISDVISVVLKQMNVKDFITSIILTRGLNVLEMSRILQGSQIAPGTLSAVL